MPDRRRLLAAIPLGALLALYGTFLATSNFISERAMAAGTLLCIGAIAILLADASDPPAVSWLTPILAVPATVCATLALSVAPTLFLTLAIATTLLLWTIQLAEHLTFDAPGSRTGRSGGVGGPVAPAGLGTGVTDADHVVDGRS